MKALVFVLFVCSACHQAGRVRRSHLDLEGQETSSGSVRRTTPAVAASERRKSLKLVRGRILKNVFKKYAGPHSPIWVTFKPSVCRACDYWLFFFGVTGLSPGVSTLRALAVPPPQVLRTGGAQDPRQAVEQHFHRGTIYGDVLAAKNPYQFSTLLFHDTSAPHLPCVRRSSRLLALWNCWSEQKSPSSPPSNICSSGMLQHR